MLSRIRLPVAAVVMALSTLPALAASVQTVPSPRLEAQRQANALFETFRIKCGTDHVVAIDVTPPSSGGFTQNLGAAPTGRAQPPVTAYDDDPDMGTDQDRIEIPAFLRRQAN